MGLPRIIYQLPTSPPTTKTIDFQTGPANYPPELITGGILSEPNYTHQVTDYLVQTHVGRMRFDFPALADTNGGRDTALVRNLLQWRIFALEGGEWWFALDRDDAISTTLASPAAIGDASIVVDDATGIVNGGTYKLQEPTTRTDIVNIASISAAPTLTLSESLNQSFATEAILTSIYYFKGRLLGPESARLRDLMPLHPYHSFVLDFEAVIDD
jgi:hypothetical protein